jgi:phospholipid transport system substrate-binding protein
MYNKNLILAAILTVLFGFTGISYAQAPTTPGETIVATINKSLEILNDPSLKGMDQFKERRQKLWDTVKAVFDFEETSRRALGQHWLPLTAQERQDFTDIFVKILRDFYLGKSDSYGGEKMVYVRELVQEDRGKVQTYFFTLDQKKIVIDFSMYKVDGTWKIYDVIVEGVSLISNYRSQFNSIISKESFAGLMEKLTEKEAEIPDLF